MTRVFILFILLIYSLPGLRSQSTDSLLQRDTIPKNSTILYSIKPGLQARDYQGIFTENKLLNYKASPVSLLQVPRKIISGDGLFYVLAGILLLFGICRTAYSRYFSNMFRVFFNSSLRQSQLTDQLVQDKLPSLLFNFFFIAIVGLYCYFLLTGSIARNVPTNWLLLGICVVGVAVIYFVKFLTLQFTGWITGYKPEAEMYTFIIFLINKIIGICLLPVVIVFAFSDRTVSQVFLILSYLLIGAMILMRFIRSYGLLQHRIKVSRFHFFLYIFALEILPLILIYKAVMIFFPINS